MKTTSRLSDAHEGRAGLLKPMTWFSDCRAPEQQKAAPCFRTKFLEGPSEHHNQLGLQYKDAFINELARPFTFLKRYYLLKIYPDNID